MKENKKITIKTVKINKELKSLELFAKELKNNYNPFYFDLKEELTDDKKAELNKNLFR